MSRHDDQQIRESRRARRRGGSGSPPAGACRSDGASDPRRRRRSTHRWPATHDRPVFEADRASHPGTVAFGGPALAGRTNQVPPISIDSEPRKRTPQAEADTSRARRATWRRPPPRSSDRSGLRNRTSMLERQSDREAAQEHDPRQPRISGSCQRARASMAGRIVGRSVPHRPVRVGPLRVNLGERRPVACWNRNRNRPSTGRRQTTGAANRPPAVPRGQTAFRSTKGPAASRSTALRLGLPLG